MSIVLASTSPRRIQMFKDLGVTFKAVAPNIVEERQVNELPQQYVRRLSQEKAAAAQHKLRLGFTKNDWFILAADTTVVLGRKLLEKPSSKAEALYMLEQLSGKNHDVLTAFTWLGCRSKKRKAISQVVRTTVTFSKRPRSFWRWYVSTGEPMDKAGAYAAQGIGLSFVESYKGSYANVVGLPLPQVIDAFEDTFGTKALHKAFSCYAKN